jgi:hypothetical protein
VRSNFGTPDSLSCCTETGLQYKDLSGSPFELELSVGKAILAGLIESTTCQVQVITLNVQNPMMYLTGLSL